MKHSINASNVNTVAPRMIQVLRDRGVEIKQSDLLEALSDAMDYRSSNALKSEANKDYNKLENMLGKLGFDMDHREESKLEPSDEYQTTVRFKFMATQAESMDDFISALATNLKMFLEWKRRGVKYEHGAADDYATFSTTDKSLAESHWFEAVASGVTSTKDSSSEVTRIVNHLLNLAATDQDEIPHSDMAELGNLLSLYDAGAFESDIIESFGEYDISSVRFYLQILVEEYGPAANVSDVIDQLTSN